MIALLKYGTPTSQTFHLIDESDTGGIAGVFVDGVLYTGDTLNAANDYTGIVTVTGLSSGTHTWQPALDGVAQGQQKTFKTAPKAGEKMKLVVAADITGNAQGLSIIAGENADYGITIGDTAYHDVGNDFGTKCGCAALPEAADAVVFQTVLGAYRCKWRCSYEYATFRSRLFSQHQWELNWHNHEFETPPFQVMTNTQDGGIKYQAAKQAADEYLFAGGCPRNGNYDSYPNPRVYRDFVVGDLHCLIFDNTSYGFVNGTAKSLFEGSVPNGSGGSNVGSQQLDWAVATMQASTSQFICLFTPAEPVHTSDNATAGAQWDTLWAAIDALQNKTVILFCGDTHQALIETLGGTKLPNNPLVVVNATPLAHPLRSSASEAWVSNNDATRHFWKMAEPLQVWALGKPFYEGAVVFPSTANGFYYTATNSGTTGGTEVWPTTIGSTVPDGGITWVCRDDKLDPDADFNYNYATVDVFPNGGVHSNKSHILVSVKNALTGQVRTSFYINAGERTANFIGGKAGVLQ